MGRRLRVVDKDKLQQAIDDAEKDGPKANLNELWHEAAHHYNNMEVPEPITFSVVALRAKEFGLTYKTTAGKKGRSELTEEQKARMQEGRKNRKSKTEGWEDAFDKMRQNFPKRFHGLIDEAQNGSRKAATDLECLDCANLEIVNIKYCTCTSCPLFCFRPYKVSREKYEAGLKRLAKQEAREDAS